MIFKWFFLVYLITSCDCMPVANNGTTPATPTTTSSTTQSPKGDDRDQTLKMIELFSKIFGPLFGALITFILSYCYCRKIHPSAKKLMEIGNKDYSVPKGTCKNKCNCWPCWSCNVCCAYLACCKRNYGQVENNTQKQSGSSKTTKNSKNEGEQLRLLPPQSQYGSEITETSKDKEKQFELQEFLNVSLNKISFHKFLKLYQKFCASWADFSHRTYCSNSKCQDNNHTEYSFMCGLLMEPVMYYLIFDWTDLFDKLKGDTAALEKNKEEKQKDIDNLWKILFHRKDEVEDIPDVKKIKKNIWCTLINFPNKPNNEEENVLNHVKNFFDVFAIGTANIVCRDDNKVNKRKRILDVSYGSSLKLWVMKRDLRTFPKEEKLTIKKRKSTDTLDETTKTEFELYDRIQICDGKNPIKLLDSQTCRIKIFDENRKSSISMVDSNDDNKFVLIEFGELPKGAKYVRIRLNDGPKENGPYLQCLIPKQRYEETILRLEKTNGSTCTLSIEKKIKSIRCVEYHIENEETWQPWNDNIDPIKIVDEISYFTIKNILKKDSYEYSIQVTAIDENKNLIKGSCTNIMAYPEYKCRQYESKEKKVNLFGYNDGKKNNIHLLKNDVVPESWKCVQDISSTRTLEPISSNSDNQREGRPIARTVSDFRELAKEYLKCNENVSRFPPRYMIYDKTVRQVGNLFKELSDSAKVITGYDVTKLLRLFGIVTRQIVEIGLEEHKWECILLLHPETQLVLINFIVQDTKELTAALQHCNNSLKAIYMLNKHNIENSLRDINLVATLVLPDVERHSLNDDYPFLEVFKKENIPFFITKDELEPTKDKSNSLKDWWDDLIKEFLFEEQNCRRAEQAIEPIFQNILAEILATVAMIETHLPRLIGNKVSTLLLNKQQLEAVYHKDQWRVITGPYGSGKSIILKAIAQYLYHKGSPSKIYYICFDPYSLLEIEISKYFEMIKKDNSTTELISVNLKEMADKAGFKVENIFQQSGTKSKNIADIINFYIGNDSRPVHILIDEYPGDIVDEKCCKDLRTILDTKMKNSTLVIAQQSVEKKHEILDNRETFEFHKSTLESAGMTMLEALPKSMRMSFEPFNLVEIAETFVKDAILSLPNISPVISVTPNTPLPPNSSNLLSLSDSTQMEHGNNDEHSENDENESSIPNFETTFTEASNGTSVDIDPHMLPNLGCDLQSKESTRFLKTTYKINRSELGHDIKGEKSQLVYLDDQFTKTTACSGKVLAEILKKLIKKHNCTIICNDMEEVVIIKYALKIMKRKYRKYTPFLLRQYPSRDDKKKIFDDDEKQSILVTDYRGCRGCESEHCITFIDQTTPYPNHVLVEMLTRAIIRVDLLILPKKEKSMENKSSSISNMIEKWEGKQDSCEGMQVTVKIISQDQSGKKLSITFQPKGEASGVKKSEAKTNVTSKDDSVFKEIKDMHDIGMSGDEAYRAAVQILEAKKNDLAGEASLKNKGLTIQKDNRIEPNIEKEASSSPEEAVSSNINEVNSLSDGTHVENKMSTPLYAINSEYWIRVNLALQHCIKSVLIDILHNVDSDPSYNGLPTNPTQLYNEMLKCKNNINHGLHKVLRRAQWNILCPTNQKTHSKDFDITILVAVIRAVIGLMPLGGWNIQALQPNDNSKGAFAFLCRNLHNDVKHGSINDIKDFTQFKTYWKRLENILVGLNFKNMAFFNSLETCSLDKINTLVIS